MNDSSPASVFCQDSELGYDRSRTRFTSGEGLILDETYRDLVAGRPHALLGGEAWPEVVIHLTSFSKSFTIPGHRIGILAAPDTAIPKTPCPPASRSTTSSAEVHS